MSSDAGRAINILHREKLRHFGHRPPPSSRYTDEVYTGKLESGEQSNGNAIEERNRTSPVASASRRKYLRILLELRVCYFQTGYKVTWKKVIACTHERGDIDAAFISTLTSFDPVALFIHEENSDAFAFARE